MWSPMALTIRTTPGNPLVPADPQLSFWSAASLLAAGLDHLGKPWPEQWSPVDRLAVALILERDDVIVEHGHTLDQAMDLVRAEIGASSTQIVDIIDDLWALRHARDPSDLERLR